MEEHRPATAASTSATGIRSVWLSSTRRLIAGNMYLPSAFHKYVDFTLNKNKDTSVPVYMSFFILAQVLKMLINVVWF